MIPREQVIERLEKVEKYVAEERPKLQSQLKEDAVNMKKLLLANQDLDVGLKRLTAEKEALEKKLEGFSALQKALATIRVEGLTPDKVRGIVKEELAGFTPPSQGSTGEGIQVTESIPYLNLQVSKPWLSLDESTVEGQILVMALNDKLPEKFPFGSITKALETEYSSHPRRTTVDKALDALVGKYKALERKVEGNQWVYSLRGDARSRVKESETKQAMEPRE